MEYTVYPLHLADSGISCDCCLIGHQLGITQHNHSRGQNSRCYHARLRDHQTLKYKNACAPGVAIISEIRLSRIMCVDV